ncbi:MAG: TetR/AcrR family transcriptional regulator [Bordetella sp.]|uniref:TetR/AcrR family transcriptional regulator n=1 Tax=Bordetella sp. TaxID=28081 RepID=UPI003F7B96F8
MSKAQRGQRTDGDATRTRILDAAGELFALAGYAETTSKAIAARAGVDQASINYHFGSRGELYQSVLAEAHRRLVNLADLRLLAGSRLAPSKKLLALIDHFVEQATNKSQGWHLKVLAQELLAPSSHLHALFQNELLPKVSVVKYILSEITGIAPDDPAIARCAISVAAPCLMLLIGARGVPGPLQDVLLMPREAITRHLHGYALAGLRAIGREHARDKPRRCVDGNAAGLGGRQPESNRPGNV